MKISIPINRVKIGAAIGLTVAAVFFMAYEQHHASQKYHRERAAYCTSISTTPEQKKACAEEAKDASDYLPWWYELFSWPVGITTWAIIGTGIVIGWQSNETRKSAEAAQKSVAIAKRQIDMLRDKERARIEITSLGNLELEETIWTSLIGEVLIRNLGPSRAYIKRFHVAIVWSKDSTDSPIPELAKPSNLLSEKFVDPTKDGDEPVTAKTYFADTDEINLDWFSRSVYDGNVKIWMHAGFEYSSVGSTYIRHCVYQWRSTKIGNRDYALGNKEPSTNSERIAAGYWHTDIDEEIEIETDA